MCKTSLHLLPATQELHASYGSQLASQGQHEQAAAHLAAAGRWAAAAAALHARGTASGAAAAVRVCQQALASGSALRAGEQGSLQQQLAEAEQALAARAAAEGTTAAAVVAALEPPQHAPPPPPADVPVSTAAPASGSQARQRYSSQQLLAVGSEAASARTPPGLPEGLAASAAPHASIPNEPAVFGRSGPSRQRYSLQALLELSLAGGAGAAAAQQAARQALPADLLREEQEAA